MPVMVKTPVLPLTLLTAAPDVEGRWIVDNQDGGLRGLFVDNQDQIRGFALAGDCTAERQRWVDAIGQNQLYSMLEVSA